MSLSEEQRRLVLQPCQLGAVPLVLRQGLRQSSMSLVLQVGGLHPRPCRLLTVGGAAGSRKSSGAGRAGLEVGGVQRDPGRTQEREGAKMLEKEEEITFSFKGLAEQLQLAFPSFPHLLICGSPGLHSLPPWTLCEQDCLPLARTHLSAQGC